MARPKKETPPVVDTNYYLDQQILSSDETIAVIGMSADGYKVLYKFATSDSNEQNIHWWDFTTDHREYSQYTAKGEIDNCRQGVAQEFLPLAWAMYAKVQPEAYKYFVSKMTDIIAELRGDLNRTQLYCMPAKFNGLDVDEKGRSILGCLKALQTKADSREVFGHGEVKIVVEGKSTNPLEGFHYAMDAPDAFWEKLERIYGLKFDEMIGETFDQAMDYLIDISCKKYLKIEELRKS